MTQRTAAGGGAAVLPTANQYFPAEGTRIVSLAYDWTQGAAFTDDFSSLIDGGRLTTLQSVFIDNADCSGAVRLTIGETQQRIVCPPGSQGVFPVFIVGGSGFTVSGGDGASTTTLAFLNVPMQSAVWTANPAIAGAFLPISGGVLTGNLQIAPPNGYASLVLGTPGTSGIGVDPSNVLTLYTPATTFTLTGSGAAGAALQGALWLRDGLTVNGTLYGVGASFTGPVVAAGVADGSNAPAGDVGEFLSATFSTAATIAASGSVVNVGSLSLTAGDWIVEGNIRFTSATAFNSPAGAVTLASATMPTFPAAAMFDLSPTGFTAGSASIYPTGSARVNASATVPVYLAARAAFATGPVTVTGYLQARRRR